MSACVVCDGDPRANCEFCINYRREEVKQMSEDTIDRFLAFQATPKPQEVRSKVAEYLNANPPRWMEDWNGHEWKSDDLFVERVWLVTENYGNSVVALTAVEGDEAVHSWSEPVVLVELKDTMTGAMI